MLFPFSQVQILCTGAAEAIPNTEFHGISGIDQGFGPISKIDLQLALDRLTHRFGLQDVPSSQRHHGWIYRIMPISAARTIQIGFATAPALTLPNRAVSTYAFLSPSEVEVQVSDGAHPDHLERGLVHELAEINYCGHIELRQGEASPEKRTALAKPGVLFAGTLLEEFQELNTLISKLTPHDIGRISELDYLFGNRGSAASETSEIIQTLTTLGFGADSPSEHLRTTMLTKLPTQLIQPGTLDDLTRFLGEHSPFPLPGETPAHLTGFETLAETFEETPAAPPLQSSVDAPVDEPEPSPPLLEAPILNPEPVLTDAPRLSPEQSAPKEHSSEPTTISVQLNELKDVSGHHLFIGSKLEDAMEKALAERSLAADTTNARERAEDNYAQAAGETGEQLKLAEKRCTDVSRQLREIRNQGGSSAQIIELQLQLRQAHFELGKLKERHNKSLSDREVREYRRRIQTALSAEDKALHEAHQCLLPVVDLMIQSLDLQSNPENELMRQHLNERWRQWAACDTELREALESSLTPTWDAEDHVERLDRDLAALTQQLERVEGRSNNQRQIDSLTQRRERVTRELERAQQDLAQCATAYAKTWFNPEVITQRNRLEALHTECKHLTHQTKRVIHTSDDIRDSTRAARISAIERQIQQTLESILGEVQEVLNALITAWANPDGDMTPLETQLGGILSTPQVWEWREQLRQMKDQRLSLEHPAPKLLPKPDSFHP